MYGKYFLLCLPFFSLVYSIFHILLLHFHAVMNISQSGFCVLFSFLKIALLFFFLVCNSFLDVPHVPYDSTEAYTLTTGFQGQKGRPLLLGCHPSPLLPLTYLLSLRVCRLWAPCTHGGAQDVVIMPGSLR